ncbi:hypothetical protein BVG19_g1899 [[Candida] boidinii]|nr:hypothetical protein BVG19_g1899 [[Candida] boidinii]OWB51417.1 hypothetical protein B5S27_g2978 [[Candida] boidinii]
MKKDQERVNNFFKLKEGLETREKEIDDEVAKYTSEIEKLKSKNKQLKTQAKETKNLLDSKISAEIKFNQERTDYEETIKSLREDIENLTQELKLEQTSHSNINKKIAKLKTEKEALVKAKKESDVEAAKLNMKLSTRGPQPSSTPIASSYIFSSESSTELARLRERLESVELKYASEQYENRRLKAYIINNGGSEDIISSLSPFRTPKRPVSIGSPIALSFTGSTPSSGSRSSELESERTVNAKLQNKLVELQAELARVKGSQRSSIGSGSAYSVTNSEESDDFKTKFRMSQVQVKNLEERLKNISRQQRLPSSSSNLSLSKFNETREFGTNISNTVNYNTDPFVSDDKKVLETRQENLRLSSQLNEAQTKLRRLQSTSDSSFIQREKIAKLEAKIQSLETIIKNQVNEIKLYKGRSDTYIDNMEESHIAVTSAKRAEEALKIELSNAKNRLSKYQGDLKKSDVKVATLNKKIQELEGDLSDSRFELRCAQEEYERLKEKYENQEELKSSASIQTTKLQDKEIEMLSKSLTEHINKEADLRKQIKSVLLQLDISKKECTASKNTNSELMKEKRLNDKIFSETIQKNEDLLTLQQEHIMKLNTLASQVNSLKTANGNLFAERDSLLRAKRDLEAKIEIINQDFEKHLAKAKEDANNAVTVVTLTNQLKEERANFAELKDELSDYEKKLKTAEEDMAKLNKESLMIIEENKALTKFNEQSNAQVRELKTQLEDMANTENAHWSERVQKLEKDLFLLNATKRNKDHKLEQLERSVRDLEHTTEGQKNTIERYENEIKSLEETINRLNDNLNEMTEREATALLNEKKAARELQQQKEQSLLLEKELLDMRLQPV